MNTAAKILLACFLLVIGLHIWGAIHPAHENWGFHIFGFFDPAVGLIALGLWIIVAYPKSNSVLFEHFERTIRRLAQLPRPVLIFLLAAVLYGGIYLFPVKLHLLGDGAILLRSVPLGITGSEITQSFRNQPLMFWIYRSAMNLHPADSAPDSYTVYYLIDLIAAGLFLLLIFWSAGKLPVPPVERVVLGALIFFGGGSQFFFGYVENYVLQYITVTTYCLTGWFALERRLSIIVPVLCFILMILLHLGTLVFLPSLIVLLLLRWKRNLKQGLLLLGGLAVLGVGALFVIGFNITDFTRHIGSESVDFLRPFSVPGGNFPYPMFSFIHLLDVFNSVSLVAPIGIFLTIVLLFTMPFGQWRKNSILLFLLTAALCGLFFAFVVNSALGLARDWDLFSSFFVPLLILPVYIFSQKTALQPRRYILGTALALMMLHWAGWIGVNASEERHLARMKILNDPRLISLTTRMVYDEALANLFFDSGKYLEAKIYYEDFMRIDSSNTRIVANISDVYRKLGEKESYFRMLQRAAALKSPNPGVYSNLGVEYASRGDTAAAIFYNEKAVSIDPSMAKAYANLGILCTAKKQYEKADKYFQTALSLGMQDKLLYHYAGNVCVYLQDYGRALQYFDAYLAQDPNDQNIRYVRERVYEALASAKQPAHR